ncbi:hypothetical protein F3Y22_tig00111151pilonHSYRG00124 [Hibiscus syriacus]|uniref:Protein kinase domain-containing protein n=1 Tax=Hibiscus syriacus TaxID=106335 RepID=A0A6A2YX79_HIBSY|nr:hypothetical protein F3Y22_tig00111151pilonHSYRG00124 [Hibiscus syriacus]
MSTRVAGTLGYVAPEYALYALFDDHTLLLTDWAWSLVEQGRLFDVIDETMPELGHPEVMEKYISVAILSSHPQLHARPTMDQIVRILETNSPVHSNPELAFREKRATSRSSRCPAPASSMSCVLSIRFTLSFIM